MNLVELSEIARNAALVISVLFGVWLALAQFLRSRRQDALQRYAKAVGLIGSDSPTTRLGAVSILLDLRSNREIRDMVFPVLRHYLEKVTGDELVEARVQIHLRVGSDGSLSKLLTVGELAPDDQEN